MMKPYLTVDFLTVVLFASLICIVIFIIPVFIATLKHRTRERRREVAVREAVPRHGLRPIPAPELPALAKTVYALRWRFGDVSAHAEVVNEPVKRGFSLTVAGREAVFLEWSYGYIQPDTMDEGGHVDKRAYLVLGAGAPHILIVPKAAFGEPADPVDFPEDKSFSKKFWVEGRDKVAVKQYLGPELRSFLLTHGKDAVFHAGPQGVVLEKGGELTVTEASEMVAILEGLAHGIEGAARRLRW